MAVLQKPKAVATGGSDWLEGFQMLYALSEMHHKSYTRKLGKEKYISDAINTAYDTFKSNPNDLGALDATIEKIGQIGQNYSAAKDSLVFQNFAQKMDTLQTERLELVDVNSKLDKFRSGDYDLQNFIGIKNAPGWHPVDTETTKSSGPSNTTIRIEDAIKELKLDSSDMDRMGRLSNTDRGNYSLKIAELEKLKGFVGYDGMLQWKDIEHMKIGPNISSVINSWVGMERGYKSAIEINLERIQRIDDRTDVPPMTSGSPAPLTESERVERKRLVDTVAEDKKAYDAVHANLLRYDWDYAMIGDPDKGIDFDAKNLAVKKSAVDGTMKLIGGQEPREWGPESINQDEEEEFQDWVNEPKVSKKKQLLIDGLIGVEAQNRKTGEREVAVKWDGKNFLNAEGDTVNVYRTTSGFQDLKDIYNEEQVRLKEEEAERTRYEPSVEKNQKLTKEIKSILRDKNIVKDLTPKQRQDMFRSIKEGTLHKIPESVKDKLSKEWKLYISENAVSNAW